MGLLDKMKQKLSEIPATEKPKREIPKSPLLEKLNEKVHEPTATERVQRDTGKLPYLLYQIKRRADKDNKLVVEVCIELDDLVDRTRTALNQFLDCLIVHQDVMRPMLEVERIRVLDCAAGDDKHDGKIVLEITANVENLLE